MNRENRNFLISVGIIAIIVVGGYAGLAAYTGFSLPFSTVVSQSMQHDNDQSSIGTIDTGDIVIVMDPSKTEIQSYVVAVDTVYESFCTYGSVIIYDRGSTKNPVIHRAIVWLDYDSGTGKWSSEELANSSVEWYCVYTDNGETVTGTDPYDIRGTLYLVNIYGKNPYVNLDSIQKTSGYLTMGDNPVTNTNFDQSSGIVNYLVSESRINSVAIAELPWLGVLKLLFSGNDNLSYVPNSLPSLLMAIVLLFSILLVFDAASMCRYQRKNAAELELSRKSRK